MLWSKTSACLLCSCLCVEKLINNTIVKTFCLRHCCKGMSKRAVHAEGGAVSINTKEGKILRTQKSPTREITDTVLLLGRQQQSISIVVALEMD